MITWKQAAVLAAGALLPAGALAQEADCTEARAIWGDVKGSGSEEALLAFVEIFGTCPIYGALARDQLTGMREEMAAADEAASPDPVPDPGGARNESFTSQRALDTAGRLQVADLPPLKEPDPDSRHPELDFNDAEYDCISLAGAPGQTPYIDGVYWSELDPVLALWACSTALLDSDSPQDDVIAAYARALNKAEDWDRALDEAERAALMGNGMAMNLLGSMYRYGNGVEKDLTTALAWYEAAAERSFQLGLFNMGQFYQYGWGVEKDPDRALALYEKGASLWEVFSKEKLGLLYRDGVIVEQDISKAEDYLIEATTSGLPSAARHLAVMYENGEGAYAYDYDKALTLYAIAADKGDVEAMHNFGLMLYNGKGISPDRDSAKQIWLEAADLGHAGAQRKYGRIAHEDGDPDTAVRYYRMSAAQGDEVAQRLLKEMGVED
ncbi:tetratricopeptide repeat protein [Pseudoruegeria sp. SHC-113]|uniref:tetratricopeptide repeat protein n=1 Tax=Pseudoruegeria sp. SHC-113 TaxID=2855439 RepID=UPI0021BB5802|nr:tetratricopeptide repeat protein [Pseudoruegeria sp. SHC-113]MCT8160742.1 sel1 repeat family protein [Pseudoruegeria sp. SHC-113]